MVVLTILPPATPARRQGRAPRNSPGIGYRKRVTASDPADEATGVVGDDGPANASPSGPVDAAAAGSVLTAEQTSTPALAAEPVVAEPVVAPDPVVPPEPVVSPEPATPALTKPPFVPREPIAAETSDDALALLDGASPRWADDTTTATALTWVDTATVAAGTDAATLDETSEAEPTDGLLRGARLRPAIARPGILVPLSTLVGIVAVYAGTTLLWPLHEVPPTVQSVDFATTPAAAATVTWPTEGAGAVGIAGMGTAASVPDAVSIASITKVVSSLMVLDRMPLALGEQGPEFSFTRADSVKYWDYRRSDQSALDVPIGGVLTEYQLLQGTLMGSANNYIDRLATEIWGSDREFARAAEVWLRERGLTGITVVTPSGFDERNVATPEALIALGERAMQNPVFAEIVGTRSVDLPGAGTVVNTNGMLDDPGVVGIKTGTLVGWNLLTAKDVVIGDTTVHLYAAALNQAGNDQRLALTRSLFTEAEAALEAQAPAVAKNTVVGQVTTPWGEKVDVITESDADVVLWNAATATATADFALGDEREQDDAVGTLTTAGPLNTITTPLVLAEDVEGPSPWWRLTHPLELLGITTDRS